MAFEPIRSEPWGGGLMAMLAQLAAQGNQYRMNAIPGMIREAGVGLAEAARRAREIREGREFADSQRRAAQEFDVNRANIRAAEEQAQIGHADTLARERMMIEAGLREKEDSRRLAGDKEMEAMRQTGAASRTPRKGAFDWTKLAGQGVAAVGSGLMSAADLQRKRQADTNRLIMAREANETKERVAEMQTAAVAAQRALARQDRASAAAVAQASKKMDALWRERQAALRFVEQRSMGGFMQVPPEIQQRADIAEQAYTAARGELFDLIAKEGIAYAPPEAPQEAASGEITDDELLRAISEGG